MKAEDAAREIWAWLPYCDDLPKTSDMIFVLGNKSDALPIEAARLFKQKIAPIIVASGGRGRMTQNDAITEADRYMKVFKELGIPDSSVLLERESTNTGENIEFTKKLLSERGYNFTKAIAVTTAMMSRRHKATLQKYWPEIDWYVRTPKVAAFEERLALGEPDEFFSLMVGEVDRLQKYPARGFMVDAEIPQSILDAKQILINIGNTPHLVSQN